MAKTSKNRMNIQIVDIDTRADIGTCAMYYAQLTGSYPPMAPQIIKYAFQHYRRALEDTIAYNEAQRAAKAAPEALLQSTQAADRA